MFLSPAGSLSLSSSHLRCSQKEFCTFLTLVPLHITCLFSSGGFYSFLFTTGFEQTDPGVPCNFFIFLIIHQASWICEFIVLTKFENFLSFFQVFSFPHSFWDPNHTYIRSLEVVLQLPNALFYYFLTTVTTTFTIIINTPSPSPQSLSIYFWMFSVAMSSSPGFFFPMANLLLNQLLYFSSQAL